MASEVHKFKATLALPWSHDGHHSTACCLSWYDVVGDFCHRNCGHPFYPFQCSDNADTTPKDIGEELKCCCCCCCRHSQPTLKPFRNCFLRSAFSFFLFFKTYICFACKYREGEQTPHRVQTNMACRANKSLHTDEMCVNQHKRLCAPRGAQTGPQTQVRWPENASIQNIKSLRKCKSRRED